MNAMLLFLMSCRPSDPFPVMPTIGQPVPPTTIFQLTPFIQGEQANLRLWGAPKGTLVTFYTSDVAEGPGTVDGVSLDLIDPQVMGTAVTENLPDLGLVATMRLQVDPNEKPRPRYFQAAFPWAESPVKSDVMLRNVAVAKRNSTVSMADVTRPAGLGGLRMTGNTHTGGAAWVDYNGDYWPDLFITNGGGIRHYLYRNNGDGTFTDRSNLVPKANIEHEDAGVVFADLENDGDLDLFVAVDNAQLMNHEGYNPREGGPNLLYINNGDGTFTEAAAAWGAVDPRGWRNSSAAFADVDRDGLIDLYVGAWAMNIDPGVYDRIPRMLVNNGDHFVDRAEALGLGVVGPDTLVSLFFDFDQNGWPDLYQGNVGAFSTDPVLYNSTDHLFANQDGLFSMVDSGSPGFGDDAGAAMGADVADIDGDGDWDLYITDVWSKVQGEANLPSGNALYHGLQDGDRAYLSDNLCVEAAICTGFLSWPTNFADFDRDGWVDLWVGNSAPGEPEQMFINRGDGRFEEHDLALGVENDTRGGATADYDGDGDVDIVVQNLRQESTLVRNNGIDGHHWIEFKLLGVQSNRAAIGAELRINTPDGPQLRRVSGGDSAHSQQDLIVHAGLGPFTEAEVTIIWPTGEVEALGVVPADSLWFVEEGRGILEEELETTVAWNAGALDIRVRSTFGGRTALQIEGVGRLPWDPNELVFQGSLASERPQSVRILSSHGGSWVYPID